MNYKNSTRRLVPFFLLCKECFADIQQVHASYNSLGRDFKHVFDGLVKQLHVQKAEADNLKRQLVTTSNAAMQANKAASFQLEVCLAEERQQAVIDRENLLSQIATLVNATGKAQDARLTAKINTVQERFSTSRTEVETANAKFADGMGAWYEKEKMLVEGVLKSEENLNTKMKQDWMVSHCIRLQKYRDYPY